MEPAPLSPPSSPGASPGDPAASPHAAALAPQARAPTAKPARSCYKPSARVTACLHFARPPLTHDRPCPPWRRTCIPQFRNHGDERPALRAKCLNWPRFPAKVLAYPKHTPPPRPQLRQSEASDRRQPIAHSKEEAGTLLWSLSECVFPCRLLYFTIPWRLRPEGGRPRHAVLKSTLNKALSTGKQMQVFVLDRIHP